MRLVIRVGLWAVLLSAVPLEPYGRAQGLPSAAKPGSVPAVAPSGFDARRANINRGTVQTVEYDSKTVGARRKMKVYTPPGYSTRPGIPSSTCCTASGATRTNGPKRARPTRLWTTSTPTSRSFP